MTAARRDRLGCRDEPTRGEPVLARRRRATPSSPTSSSRRSGRPTAAGHGTRSSVTGARRARALRGARRTRSSTGIGVWGNNIPVAWAFAHHQLRLVDRHRPRRHVHLRHPPAPRAAVAHVDQPLRRGDDALRGRAGGALPALPPGPAVVRLLARPLPVRRWASGRSSRVVAPVGRRRGHARTSRSRSSSGTSGLIPDLAAAARSRADAAAAAHLRHLRARLARVGARTGATTASPTWLLGGPRDAARPLGPLASSASTSRSRSCPAGTRPSSRRTSSPAPSSRASRWC